MRSPLFSYLLPLLAPIPLRYTVTAQTGTFNVTAISALDNASRLECWQLEAPGVAGRGAINFDLGNFQNAFVGIIPAFTTSGTIGNAVTKQ